MSLTCKERVTTDRARTLRLHYKILDHMDQAPSIWFSKSALNGPISVSRSISHHIWYFLHGPTDLADVS